MPTKPKKSATQASATDEAKPSPKTVPQKIAGTKKAGSPANKKTRVEKLLSGNVVGRSKSKAVAKRKDKQISKLPGELGLYADLLVAGRKIAREIDYKVDFAEKQVKEFCLRRFAQEFTETGRRPESENYEGRKAVFTFIQTRRITLTPDKVEALRRQNISLDGETELKGIKINYQAIREHKLEDRLRDALEQMGVKKDVLFECFHPDVELKESFFDHLGAVVKKSLQKGEDPTEKMFCALQILDPTNQIRNAELPEMNAVQSYKLVHDADVTVPESLDSAEV